MTMIPPGRKATAPVAALPSWPACQRWLTLAAPVLEAKAPTTRCGKLWYLLHQ